MDKISPEKRQEYIDVLQECLDGTQCIVYPLFLAGSGLMLCQRYQRRVSKSMWPLPSDVIRCNECPIALAGFSKCRGVPVRRDKEGYPWGTSMLDESKWTQILDDHKRFIGAVVDHLKAGHELDKFKEMTDYDWRKDA